MSGTLEINDKAVWMPAGWVYDNALQEIAKELEKADRDLSRDLLGGLTHGGPGYCDLKKLPAAKFRKVVKASRTAYDNIVDKGEPAFVNPKFYAGFIKLFAELNQLLEGDSRAGTQ